MYIYAFLMVGWGSTSLRGCAHPIGALPLNTSVEQISYLHDYSLGDAQHETSASI